MIEKVHYSRIRIIFLIAIIVLLTLSVFSFIKTKTLVDASALVNHTYVIKNKLESSVYILTNMETNERGYLISKDTSFLQPYSISAVNINSCLHDIDSLTKDNTYQQQNAILLRTLIYKRIGYLESMLAEYRTSTAIAQEYLMQTFLTGKTLMEEVRRQVDKMQAEEDQLLHKRSALLTKEAFITPLATVFLIIASIVVLIASYFRIVQKQKIEDTLKSEIVESEERFLKIFHYNPVPMTLSEIKNNKIKYANKPFYDTFGYTEQEVIGHSSEELNLVGPEENQRLIALLYGLLQESRTIAELRALSAEEKEGLLIKLKQTDAMKNLEVLYTRKNGETFPAVVSFEIMRFGDERYTIASYQDITERKRVQEQLTNQNEILIEANKELESFNYISSHDLQEPLRQIQVLASRIIAEENKNLTDKGKNYFEKMQKAANHMQTLIANLLDYSRTKTVERKFETTDLRIIAEQVKTEFKDTINEKHATIEIGEMCEAKIIPFQFRQLMYNLIGNSLKFSTPDIPPHIKIESRNEKYSNGNNANLTFGKEYCHISISDNGIGFEPQYKDRIFEIFQRLHDKQTFEGTGVGLAIVKKIVEIHKGIITASSELNKGATFDIYIPTN